MSCSSNRPIRGGCRRIERHGTDATTAVIDETVAMESRDLLIVAVGQLVDVDHVASVVLARLGLHPAPPWAVV